MPDYHDQVRRALPPLFGAALVAGMATLTMGSLILFAEARGLSPSVLLYNPAYLFRYWPYAGLPLHLGVFAMVGTGAICCFAACSAGRERALLFAVGAFSLLLAADDFFMLHQHFWPKRGVPPVAVYAVYAALAGVGIVTFRRNLRFSDSAAAWLSLLLLAGSIAVDRLGTDSLRVMVIEDTLKFAGFILWTSFWIFRAHRAVSGTIRVRNSQGVEPISEGVAN